MSIHSTKKEAFSRVVIDAQLADVGRYLTDGQSVRYDVTPKLREAEWETLPYSLTEQCAFTDGRVVYHARATALHNVKMTRTGWFDRIPMHG